MTTGHRAAVMGDVSWCNVWWGRRGLGMLLLLWIFTAVPPSYPQPPLPLSLPVQMSIVPPPWQFLPLSQADLGPLFSNSSPFSFSQSLLVVPPPGQASRPGLQASFGTYSVTQLISEPVLPLSPPLSAALLSEHVERERDEGGKERFRVRALFHMRGEGSTRGTCVTLHAFKETEEHKASCITQPPLGLCVVTLTLPNSWFEEEQLDKPYHGLGKRLRHRHYRRWAQSRELQRGAHRLGGLISHRWPSDNSRAGGAASLSLRYHPGVEEDTGMPGALRYQRGPNKDRIQLYYSTFGTVANLKLSPPRCVEDKLPHSQRQLFFIKAVALREEGENKKERNSTKEEEACLNGQEEEELSLDSHVLIRYHRGPVQIGQPIGVSVNLRANFSAEFVIIRLKVKKGLVSMVAQRTLTSDLWAVTLERTQGSKHDIVSIICHKLPTHKHTHSPSVLQQVVCLSVDGLRRSFGVAMTVSAHWSLEYSGRNNSPSPYGAAVSVFSFADRHIVGIAPIMESDTIINTAILTNEPVSLPVIVLATGHDGKVSDVTTAVTCHSTNENIIKVSSDCSAIFVDGSESGVGSTCVGVEFLLGTLSGSVCLAVWAPSVPLRVSLEDPVLNAIDGWNYFTEQGCSPVFQRSSVQVLTQFTAQDTQSRTTHLLGSSDWFVDVTELVRNWLRVEDPRVASLGTQNNLVGLQPGKTSLHVISGQWDGVLGSCDITVTSDPVLPGDLSVQVVSGLGMSIMASPAHPSIVTSTVTAYNILYNHQQEASISVWLQFSDDTASLLSAFSGIPFFLRVSSLAETVAVVMPGPTQRIIARGDGGGPLLRAELLVSTCVDQPITSNSIAEGNVEGKEHGGRGGTRRLAKGSGWIRVNLDSELFEPVGNEDGEAEEFEFDISDTLVESDGDVYMTNFDEHIPSQNVSTGGDYYDKIMGKVVNRNWNNVGKGRMVTRNNLERAVLMPNHEESAVYFSPSQEKEGGWREEREQEDEEQQGDRELEVGLAAVLSLLCLSTILFLANCLPCALRERRRKTTTKDEEEEEGDIDGVADKDQEQKRWRKKEVEGKEREEEEWKKPDAEETEKHEQREKKEDVKEVEIIC
ncbi:transmembrane protein 132D [Myripristis murdjan]|uniref:transmembrane protein 132D n=1 Tax=Myripristis murdjan TaxID=586833 RepID=UPI001175FF62|nr:transmembrane protein 132D-like [Myripristis murdjan]